MNRAQIIETMARALDPHAWTHGPIGESARQDSVMVATDVLTALEAAGMVVVAGCDLETQAAEIERLTNNRDMWKGQCERQAKVIQCYRDYQATVPASRAWAASAQD